MTIPPRVFASYTHDSDEHRARVLGLANRLREDEVDAHLDQYDENEGPNWPKWMFKQIREAEYVLIVCTAPYRRRFEDTEEVGKGAGAKWEGAIVTQELYESEGANSKFVPVIFDTADRTHIPTVLRGVSSYLVDNDQGYDKLLRRLRRNPLIVKPPLGEKQRPPAAILSPSSPTGAAKDVLKSALASLASARIIASKFSVLNPAERNFVVDQLLMKLDTEEGMSALGAIVNSGTTDLELDRIATSVMRTGLVSPDVLIKARLMRAFPPGVLLLADKKVRTAFFEEIIDIMRRDQFSEVNIITPAVVIAHGAIPATLRREYIEALFLQARSMAFEGRPAAERAIGELHAVLVPTALKFVGATTLIFNDNLPLKELLTENRKRWPSSKREMFEDYLRLGAKKFRAKYWETVTSTSTR